MNSQIDLLKFAAGKPPETPKSAIFQLVNGKPELVEKIPLTFNGLNFVCCLVSTDKIKAREQGQIYLKFGDENLATMAGMPECRISFFHSLQEAREFLTLMENL